MILLLLLSLFLIAFDSASGVKAKTCNNFFHGNSYPIPKPYLRNQKALIKLCQNQMKWNEVKNKWVDQPVVFATLYDYTGKIPVYSASKVKLDNTYTKLRPRDGDLWSRMASSLCYREGNGPYLSRIKKVDSNVFGKCKKWQAVNQDYTNNQLSLTKGHLEPSNMNNNEVYRQQTTFTLTNVAPQYAAFNSGSWNMIECLTKKLIENKASNREVYIVTGISRSVKDNNDKKLKLNEIRVPGRFWKAVCFPGVKNTPAWSYVVKIDNKNVHGPRTKNEIKDSLQNLKTYMKELFGETKDGNTLSPFGNACLNATPDSIKTELDTYWDTKYSSCDSAK